MTRPAGAGACRIPEPHGRDSMQKVVLFDDIDGKPADGTVMFALDGTGYEIDLKGKHETQLREILAPYIAVARRPAGAPNHRTGRARTRSAAPVSRYGTLSEVREWARSQGIEVKPKGRLAAELVDRYHAAQQAKP